MNDEQIAQFNANKARHSIMCMIVFWSIYLKTYAPVWNASLPRLTFRQEKTCWMLGPGREPSCRTFRKYQPGRIYVCDLSGKMLEQVAQHYPEVERHQADIRDLDLPGTCVDVVFMNGMYGNIADKPGALRNIMRMLRPGGRVVISHPEGRAFVEGLVRSEPFPITSLPSPDEAHAFLGSHGLAVTQYTDEEKLLIVVAVKQQ